MVRSHILHAVYGLLLCLAYQLTDKMAEGSNQSTINTAFLRAIGPTTLGDLLEGNTVGDVGGVNSSCLDVRDSFSSLLPCLENQVSRNKLNNYMVSSPLKDTQSVILPVVYDACVCVCVCLCVCVRACVRACVCVCVVVHWHCSAQLSMFNMEKRYRNKSLLLLLLLLLLCAQKTNS